MPRFKCDECEAIFPKSMDLARHYRWNHRREKKMPFKCEQCDKSFNTPQGLSLHTTRTHRGMGGNPGKACHPRKISKNAAPAVSFCPCCGTNIRLFSQALAAIGGLQNG